MSSDWNTARLVTRTSTISLPCDAGFLDEYTVRYFGRPHWQVPVEVQVDDFHRWQRQHLRGHKPETRLIGSWGYRQR